MGKLYFAHPINTYGTPIEAACLLLIAELFPDFEVVNPSDQIHLDKVAELRKADPSANVMPYFVDLVDTCDDVIVLPFGDGKWGAGVWAEAERIDRRGGAVWVINLKSNTVTLEFSDLAEFRLTVEETRARIRHPDGTTREYE